MKNDTKYQITAAKNRFILKKSLSIVLLAVLVFMAACQPTPEENIVVGKSDVEQAIIDKTIDEQGSDVLEGNASAVAEGDRLVWQDQYLGSEGIFVLNIDANVYIPDVGAYTVVRIKPVSFTEEHLKKVVDLFFGDRPIYNGDVPSTKEELEAAIVSAKLRKSTEQDGMRMSDDYIKKLEQDYLNAPDHVELELIEPQWIKTSAGKEVSIMAQSNKSGYDRITGGVNGESNLSMTKHNATYTLTADLVNQPHGVAMSIDDAEAVAANVLCQLGLTNMHMAGAFTGSEFNFNEMSQLEYNDNNQCYVLCFTRVIDGIPLTYVRQSDGETDSEEPVYAPSIPKECITFFINDSGVIKFEWCNPYEEIETISENIALLSFEEIQAIFMKHMIMRGDEIAKYYGKGKYEVISDVINVYKVTLGMMVIAEKNKPSSYICIPVWDFFVTTHREYKEDPFNGVPRRPRVAYSILTINAIDGSIINRNLGY